MDASVNAKETGDQKLLRQVEALCTQEEPPACTAACPLHVDARALAKQIAGNDWKAAFQLFQKAVPFPNIVAHACDAPCQSACRRAEIGGAIEIHKLELAATLREAQEPKGPLFLPKKNRVIGIVGGGLRGMAAAMDLARKGYQATIFEATDRLGGHLWTLNRAVLPAQAIEKDIAALLKFPVSVRYNQIVACADENEIRTFMDDNALDAAYLACGTPFAQKTDPETLLTPLDNVVAGRRDGRWTKGISPIYDIYDGRSAATALDRILQGVSVTAGREKEGSMRTRLYTDLAPYAHTAPIDSQDGCYTDEQAVEEAGRCIQCECLECVKQCAFMRHYKSYPRRYVREVYNNLSIAMGIHHANGMINACTLCGQCAAVCPNGLNMADVFLAARRQMAESGKMPPSAHEFALLDMEYSLSDAYFTARHQPGHQTGKYLFFPGCQLGASEPDLVETVYGDLCGRMPGGVSLMLSCCGVMAHWAGQNDTFQSAVDTIRTHWQTLGEPQIITACPSCFTTLGNLAGLPVVGIWDILEEIGLPAGTAVQANRKTLAIHDACGTRYDDGVQRGVRALARKLGYALEELSPTGQATPCCGYGGLVPFTNAQVADKIAQQRAEQNADTSGWLTYCVNCRDRYLSQGVQAYHLLELVYGQADTRRQPPTWSERQENRAALKRELLGTLWGEIMDAKPEIELHIEEELAALLETRMILRSDIKQTIARAEEAQARLLNPETNRYIASYRPQNVTFWVEYQPREGGGYTVFNAYSHRMAAQAANRAEEGQRDG